MGRFSESTTEDLHVGEMARQLVGPMLVELRLKGGLVVDGVIRNLNAGNNGLVWGRRQYRGDVTLELIDGTVANYDFLDIEEVRNVWVERSQAFMDAGKI
jgi:hypothetical protein